MIRYVQPAPEGTVWGVSRREFEELLAARRESATVPDWPPYRAYRHTGDIGIRFLFETYKRLRRGRRPPNGSAASRTVFILKSNSVGGHCQVIRASDALRLLTLCNYDCTILTTAICAGLRKFSMSAFAPHRDSSRDNVFEIETTVIVHRACLLNDLASFLPISLARVPAWTTGGSFWYYSVLAFPRPFRILPRVTIAASPGALWTLSAVLRVIQTSRLEWSAAWLVKRCPIAPPRQSCLSCSPALPAASRSATFGSFWVPASGPCRQWYARHAACLPVPAFAPQARSLPLDPRNARLICGRYASTRVHGLTPCAPCCATS